MILEQMSYQISLLVLTFCGIILILSWKKRPLILGISFILMAISLLMRLYASSHIYTDFENLFFSFTLIGVFITQGFYFYSLFYADTPNYRWFKVITAIVAATLMLLSIILINEPVEPQGAINSPICLIIGYSYILCIYIIALANFFKIILNRQSKRKLRIFYSSLAFLIFSLVASNINLPLGALMISISVVISTWGYLIFLIPSKRKEPKIQAETGQLIKKDQRFKSIDSVRGMAMVGVVGFHIIIGLYKSPLKASEYFRDPLFTFFSIISTLAALFFIPAGASILFSMDKRIRKRNEPKEILMEQIKRGIFLILLGTVYDFFVFDFHWGIIDILQITGLAIIIISLLYYPLIKKHYVFYHEKKQKNMIDQNHKKFVRKFIILALGMVLFSPIARILFGYPIEDPNIDFFISYAPPTNFIESIQAWLTTSIYPIFPCLGFYFLGSAIGAVLLINKNKDQATRKSFAKLLLILAIFFQIAGLILKIIGESLAGELLLLPYNDQPKWVIEVTLNLQPISTVLFLLQLSITLLIIGIFYYGQDIEHSGKRQEQLDAIKQKLRLQYLLRILTRFSYASLTIYILQYLWVVILRFYQLATGIQVLYTIESFFVIVIWIIFAILFFVVLSYYIEKYDYKYGFEWLDRKVQLLLKKTAQ